MPIHPLIPITIYGSLLCYVLAAGCWVSKQRGGGYRWLWTIGCGMMWAHAIAAFHFYHDWSHASAVELTAIETERVLGQPYGNGIWYSYGLLVLWAVDAALCWKARQSSLHGWLTASVHAYAFFILFNGTVIFESGMVRWAGVVGTIWLIRMAWRFRKDPVRQTA